MIFIVLLWCSESPPVRCRARIQTRRMQRVCVCGYVVRLFSDEASKPSVGCILDNVYCFENKFANLDGFQI